MGRRAPSREDEAWENMMPLSVGTAPQEGGFLGLGIRRDRFRTAFACVLILFLGFGVRIAYLQGWEGDAYRLQAEGNRSRTLRVPSARGVILDRAGRTLAENVPAFTLTLRIEDLPEESTERDVLFDRVADLVGLQRTDLDLLLQEYAAFPSEDIVVWKDVDYARALLLMVRDAELPGFSVQVGTKRRYPASAASMSHVLGYVGKISVDEFVFWQPAGYARTDEIGKSGVELALERELRGTFGKKRIEVDALGEESVVLSEEMPIDGEAVTLSIDAELQTLVENRLRETLDALQVRKGSVVVMDSRNGEILSLVSWPAYDNNAFARGIDTATYEALQADPAHPLFPRATAGEFSSGSTIKPYVAAAALAEELITPSTSFLSTGGLYIDRLFPDWKAGGHGVTDVRKALAESVNTFFYIIGGGYDTFVGLGVDRIVQYARSFGFGSPSGIELPGEASGFLPSKEWKEQTKGERWYLGDTYHLAIGQGDLLVTPLQMTVATATVANGGMRWTPHVVRDVGGQEVSPEGVAVPQEIANVLSTVREGMRQAVTQGSARALAALPIAAAGKTGTAQPGGDVETHAWFTGFAPYDDPEIVVAVLVENGGEGSAAAVPIARDIFAWWAEHHP